MSVSATMRSLKAVGPGRAEIRDTPIPKVKGDYILVKVRYVALNPTDWFVVYPQASGDAVIVATSAYRSPGNTSI
jgi:NADPH:quinone reductase-like Zn-dependent oxidoreductase